MLVMVLGVLAYGYIVASVAASLANADSGRAQYQEKLEGIKSFMRVSETVCACVCVCARTCVQVFEVGGEGEL